MRPQLQRLNIAEQAGRVGFRLHPRESL
jgi:hypothetical protein